MNCLLPLFAGASVTSRSTVRFDTALVYSCNDAVSQVLSCHSLRFRSFAYTFRCSRGQIDVCTKMTTPSQLGTLRGKIDELEAKILKIEEALAAAQVPADIAFLRQQLGDLNKKEIILREQETILLRGQVSGEHCLLCYLLPSLG